MKPKIERALPMRTEKRTVHGQVVEVKIYPIGASNYEEEDELEELLRMMEPAEVTVNPTGQQFYLRKED